MGESEVRYTHAGDVDIAWTVTGSGPTDIVYVPGFISHLDLARELPVFDAVIGRLGRLGRVLAFDKRGTGLSGRDLGFGSLSERADDIRVVMDAAGWERAHLLGISEGGPLSLLFAASFPERVQSLVLYGSFACLLPEDDPASADFDVPRFLDYVERNWGTGQVLGAFVHAPPSPAILEQFGMIRTCLCVATSRGGDHAIESGHRCPAHTAGDFDACARHTPRSDDPIVGIARGRAMATALRNAQFVEIAGEMHCGWDAREWAPALDAMEGIYHRYAGCK